MRIGAMMSRSKEQSLLVTFPSRGSQVGFLRDALWEGRGSIAFEWDSTLSIVDRSRSLGKFGVMLMVRGPESAKWRHLLLITAYSVISDFGIFGERLMQAVMRAVFPDPHFAQVNSLDELKISLEGKKVSAILAFSKWPEKELVDVLRRVNRKSIIFFEEPKKVVSDCKIKNNVSSHDALQAVSKNFSTISYPLLCGDALLLSPESSFTFGEIIKEIIDFSGIDASDYIIENVYNDLSLDSNEVRNLGVGEVAGIILGKNVEEVECDQQEIIKNLSCVYNFKKFHEKNEIETIVWNGELFFGQNSSVENFSADGSWTELLGPSRFLYFGPYLYLPIGSWSVTIDFRVRNNLTGNKINVDIFQDRSVVAFGNFDVPSHGAFNISCDFTNRNSDKPIELRVFMIEGAIDGQIILDCVRFYLSRNSVL